MRRGFLMGAALFFYALMLVLAARVLRMLASGAAAGLDGGQLDRRARAAG